MCKPCCRIWLPERWRDPRACSRAHRSRERRARQQRKRREPNSILELARKPGSDLGLDRVRTSSEINHALPRLDEEDQVSLTGSSMRARHGVQNQCSDGDDESDDLSSNVSAL